MTELRAKYLADLVLEPLVAALRVLPERRERHDDPYEEGDNLKERPDQRNICVIQACRSKSVRLQYPVVAEDDPKHYQEGLDVADHLAGRVRVDQGPLSIESVHLFLDLLGRLVDEDLLAIAVGDGLELLALVRAPGHEAMHEVGGVDGVVGCEGDHEAVIESTRALHEGILLFLQHDHHVVD